MRYLYQTFQSSFVFFLQRAQLPTRKCPQHHATDVLSPASELNLRYLTNMLDQSKSNVLETRIARRLRTRSTLLSCIFPLAFLTLRFLLLLWLRLRFRWSQSNFMLITILDSALLLLRSRRLLF